MMDKYRQDLRHAVIFHPAAIGDAMLATPVAVILRRNFPQLKITYWSHESLKSLIDMCPCVDDFVAYKRKSSIFSLAGLLKELRPDIFVDLSNSLKGKLMAALASVRAVHYKKRKDGIPPIQHATDNFLDTVRPLVNDITDETQPKLFPTIFPPRAGIALLMEKLVVEVSSPGALLAISPGVGKVRPSRAWTEDGLADLISAVAGRGTHVPVLIGGADEQELGMKLCQRSPVKLLNLCGRLTLAETAMFLSSCELLISGDTGPAHLSVAVGTPVIGLYGPTAPERSGPYGYGEFLIDRHPSCRCPYLKECRITGPGTAGDCMAGITALEVMEKVDLVLLQKTTL